MTKAPKKNTTKITTSSSKMTLTDTAGLIASELSDFFFRIQRCKSKLYLWRIVTAETVETIVTEIDTVFQFQ